MPIVKVFMPRATVKCPHCHKDFKVDVWRIIKPADISCIRCGETISVEPVYDNLCVLKEGR